VFTFVNAGHSKVNHTWRGHGCVNWVKLVSIVVLSAYINCWCRSWKL